MRVLLVAPPWLRVPPAAYGGIEWVVGGLADGLVAAGHEVTLVASGGSSTRAHLETVFEEPPFEKLGDARVESIHALSAYHLRHGYDIVHDHTAAVGPALASLVDGPPVVHTLHLPWTDDQVRLVRLVSPPVELVAISHDQAGRAPTAVEITAVVHNGIPVERYPFSADKDDYLLFLGRANPEKGPEVAIEVARRLHRSLVLAIKVNERNERTYWEDVLQPLIRSSTIDIDVVANPVHERKAGLLARATALLMPVQWDEPFGLVMPEGNACGTPVVAFDRGAVSEIIAHGTTGFVVPPGDLDAFCRAVDLAADLDPAACREHVEKWFSAHRMVADYEEVYRTVVDDDLPRAAGAVL